MFSLTLKAMRINAGLTAQELADKVGVHKVTLLEYERGASEPKYSRVCEIAHICNCPTELIDMGRLFI